MLAQLKRGPSTHRAIFRGKLLDEFNAETSLSELRKAVNAIKHIRDHIDVSGLEWIDDIQKEVDMIERSSA